MKKILLLPCAMVLTICHAFSQNTIKGKILDFDTQKPIHDAVVQLRNNVQKVKTDVSGNFLISEISDGDYILEISYYGYNSQKFPIQLNGNLVDLGVILLSRSIEEEVGSNFILLSDDELINEDNSTGALAGVFQSAKDVFLRTAAFDFGSSFFRIRGLDGKYGKIILNGIEMNKMIDGRPQWSNWGGLNDVFRNQVHSHGIRPSDDSFGGIQGTTSISARPSEQNPGLRFSYASSNRSYTHRLMATYASGVRNNGFSYVFSGSRRASDEGFQEGTMYDAYSFFGAIEKQFNDNHTVGFTGIFALNQRGKAAPMTQEVFAIKGIRYNEYWGFINGKKVNSRVKKVFEPILQLSHFWRVSNSTKLQTNVAYQFGNISNSRIDFNGGSNPSPTYYQRLPSYNLRNKDIRLAFENLTNFQNSGQLDWNQIFDANITNAQVDAPSSYVIYEDRNDDQLVTLNTILEHKPNEHVTIHSKLEFRKLQSHNYAKVINLLGGKSYLDVNAFASNQIQQQNNLNTPNRFVTEEDHFKYNYHLISSDINGFVQAQFQYSKFDFYASVNFSNRGYQRIGNYQNGRFPDHSFGASEQLNFFNYGIKSGGTYKFTGRHLFSLNFGYFSNPPSLRNTFSNSRENNFTVDHLKSESNINLDLSYLIRYPKWNAKLTGYFIDIRNATEVSFYFADGLRGNNNAFVQEILTGIGQRNIGLEFGVERDITSTIKLKGVAALGQFVYQNNPNLYLTSDDANTSVFNQVFRSKNYTSLLNSYRLANGPQRAFSLGFEYRDPDYWWISSTANFFTNTYVDIAPLNRTSNFYEDSDGLPFNDYEPDLARSLLKQERFDDYLVVNLVGGKSFRFKDAYISIFASINNLFNQTYKTGGFEQARNSNFRELRDDQSLETPVFGNKYWFGRGTNYFITISYRN